MRKITLSKIQNNYYDKCQGCSGVNDYDKSKTGRIIVKQLDLSKQGNNINWLKYYSSGEERESICVDICIKEEIEWLLNQGVQTVNCCCGHGEGEPNCLIRNESINLVLNLGYIVDYNYKFANSESMKLIYLKGKKFKGESNDRRIN